MVSPEIASGCPTVSTAPVTQTLSPDIHVGYAKNKNALIVKAGFKIFIPVPPNTSFPITTPKITAIDSIHSGISTGTINGTNIPVTRYPSSTS